MRALNLLPQDIKLAKRTVRPGFVHAAIAVVALLVAGGMGLLYHAQTQQVDERKSAIEDLQAQIAAIKATAKPTRATGPCSSPVKRSRVRLRCRRRSRSDSPGIVFCVSCR